MVETHAISRASFKAQLADYSRGANAQLERPGFAANIRNWVSYSAAAASALAAVASADAGVIYSGIRNVVSGPNLDGIGLPGNVNIDDKGDIEFQVFGYESGFVPGFEFGFGSGQIRAPNSLSKTGVNAIFGSILDGDAIRFPSGQTLGTSRSKGSFKRLVRLASNTALGQNFGSFQNTTMGFVGFRFNPGDGNRYGWIRLHLEDSNKNNLTDMVTAVDWAYESEIDTPIVVGDQGTAVPEPSSLTIVGLAMGCAALPALRRRRQLRQAGASESKG